MGIHEMNQLFYVFLLLYFAYFNVRYCKQSLIVALLPCTSSASAHNLSSLLDDDAGMSRYGTQLSDQLYSKYLSFGSSKASRCSSLSAFVICAGQWNIKKPRTPSHTPSLQPPEGCRQQSKSDRYHWKIGETVSMPSLSCPWPGGPATPLPARPTSLPRSLR
jgi:hypothetical protein